VLTLDEVPQHPHMQARAAFVEIDGVVQPAPAPRFSRTVPATPTSAEQTMQATPDEALAGWLDAAAVGELKRSGTLAS